MPTGGKYSGLETDLGSRWIGYSINGSIIIPCFDTPRTLRENRDTCLTTLDRNTNLHLVSSVLDVFEFTVIQVQIKRFITISVFTCCLERKSIGLVTILFSNKTTVPKNKNNTSATAPDGGDLHSQ